MKLESSQARKSAILAISSASPILGFRLIPAIALSIPNLLGLYIVVPIFVFTAPGAIALQRIPKLAYWNPTFFVKPTTACFEAVYAAPALDPKSPPADAILIMMPDFFLTNIGIAFLLHA